MSSARSVSSGSTLVETYACLSFLFRVSTTNAELAAAFADLIASCAVSEPADAPAARLELREADGEFAARLDTGAWTGATDRNELLLVAMGLIDGGAVDASADELLVIHASAVMTAAGPVVFVGPSGAGKSTLAAACARHGWPYIGDEAIALDEPAAHLFANPKPFKLDLRSRRAVFGGPARRHLEGARIAGEMLVAPNSVGPVVSPGAIAAPVAVVSIAYRSEAEATVAPISRADVAEVLADQCFNFARWGARGLETVAALARVAAGYRLEFGDLGGALDQLERVLE